MKMSIRWHENCLRNQDRTNEHRATVLAVQMKNLEQYRAAADFRRPKYWKQSALKKTGLMKRNS